MALLEQLSVRGQVVADHFVRLLRDDEQRQAQSGDRLHAVSRHRTGVHPPIEGPLRRGPDVPLGDLEDLTVVLDVASPEALQQDLGALVEAHSGLVHRHPVALEFDAAQPTSNPNDQASVADIVQHRDLLDHTDGVVPRKHDYCGPQPDGTGSTGHVGQELERIWAHGVVGEMVFDSPHRVELEPFCLTGERKFVPIYLGICLLTVRVLP